MTSHTDHPMRHWDRTCPACNEGASMKFRKKPVVIEAVQWFKMGDHPAVIESQGNDGSYPFIDTLEGPHLVSRGDWIITGVKGEYYPCKPDIFEMTYEPVEQA